MVGIEPVLLKVPRFESGFELVHIVAKINIMEIHGRLRLHSLHLLNLLRHHRIRGHTFGAGVF